jgi:hypothetical protein
MTRLCQFREVSECRNGAFISCMFAVKCLAERREEEYRDSHEIRLGDGSQGGARFYDSSLTISVVGRKIGDIRLASFEHLFAIVTYSVRT